MINKCIDPESGGSGFPHTARSTGARARACSGRQFTPLEHEVWPPDLVSSLRSGLSGWEAEEAADLTGKKAAKGLLKKRCADLHLFKCTEDIPKR